MRVMLQVLGGATTFGVVFVTALLMDDTPRGAALLGASLGLLTFSALGIHGSRGWFRNRRAVMVLAGLAGSSMLFVAVTSLISRGSAFVPLVGLATAAIYVALMILESRRGRDTSAA